MENKDYKRIPVLPSTKKEFDVAKAGSDCKTQDEFILDLLVCREMLFERRQLHFVKFPSIELALREIEGRILITRGVDNKNWVDITDMIPE